MTAAPEGLQALVEEALRGRRIAIADELGATATLWLAAAPIWTRSAAEAVSFPVESVPDFVRRAGEAGWCETRGSARGQGSRELRFWMPDTVRREVIGSVISRVGYDSAAEQVTGIAIDLAPRVRLLAQSPDVQSPGALRAWTDLVGHVNAGERAGRLNVVSAATRLVEQAQQAAEAGDLTLAQDLVEAGEALAAVFGGTAEQALSRARRLLALGLQRRQDERALDRYLDRRELTGSVTRLLQTQAPPWALHLRGVGGVGKTMLIRYLASGRYARDRGIDPVPIARADFDHISPDYPVRRPVQLLLELADELALHTAASYPADRALLAFRARAARAHESVSGLREAGAPPLSNPEVAKAVDDFGAVLSSLGNVLLILDTCEELAKADAGNPAAPAVRATLDILERLHDRAPSTRVLFAGRRPLPERDYLVVQPVAGFTVAEARRYLGRDYAARRDMDAQDREQATAGPLPPGLADAMIRQSPALDGPVPREGELPQRVSPFDLALYAAWADEDPALNAAQVNWGSDAYIEGRIIERLDDPLVVRALPVLACAGRCSVATIADFLNCDAATLGGRLAAQEWIDAHGNPANGTGHVAATPALARRLRGYFDKDERRAEFAARSAALASFLLPRLRDTPLADLDVDELIAALRLSPPAEAAALWDSIAGRAMQPPGRWGTVLNMTRRILGEWEPGEWEDGAWPTANALRATVTAAHIAGSRRDSPSFGAHGHWEMVRAWSESHPVSVMREMLLIRATLGLLPHTADGGPLREAVDVISGFPPAAPELGAGIADAVHRLLEAGRAPAARELTDLLDSAEALGASPRVGAWIDVARARLCAGSDVTQAVAYLVHADYTTREAADQEPSWPDWIPPDDLLARVRIELGLIAPPDDLSVLDKWESYAADHLNTIDGERLVSLCLRVRLRHGVIDATVARRWEFLDAYTPDRVPTCTAHDLIPPSWVSVAEAWMSAGEPDRALDLLGRRRSEALGTRLDEATVRHADAATVKIVRRLRLESQLSLLYRLESAADSNPGLRRLDLRYEAWRAKSVIHQQPPDRTQMLRSGEQPPAAWHAWWQSQIGNWQAAPVDIFLGPTTDVFLEPSFPADPATIAQLTLDDADLAADLEEMSRLGHPGLAGQEHAMAVRLSGRASAGPPARSAEPYYDVRAAMRRAALIGDDFTPRGGVPKRLLAEMAFEEAELTALRLPDVAAVLFEISARAYAEAGDHGGSLLAAVCVVTIAAANHAAGGQLAGQALSALWEQDQALANKLTRPPQDAGSWRYWAERVQRPVALSAPPTEGPGSGQGPDAPGTGDQGPYGVSPATPVQPPPGSADGRATAASRRRVVNILTALAVCALIALAVLTPTEFLRGVPASGHPAGSSGGLSGAWAGLWAVIAAAALVALIAVVAAIGSRSPGIRRLADERGVGVTRPRNLLFNVTFVAIGNAGDAFSAYLLARTRPWRTAPLRAKAALAFLAPAVWLAARSRQRPYGYLSQVLDPAAPRSPLRFTWPHGQLEVSGTWWRAARGSVPGVIDTRRLDAPLVAQPWERLVSASLGPGAAGRIEWIRLVSQPASYVTSSAKSVLSAPYGWRTQLSEVYSPPRGAGLTMIGARHVIGHAVTTAAGPCMDIGEPGGSSAPASGSGPDSLLGAQELLQGQPGIVILQAEPAADSQVSGAMPDDQAEKLALAAELAHSGVPAVLLLPVLPGGSATGVSHAITTHVTYRRGGDGQVLLSRLRKVIAPDVPPAVLDDVVLFLNESRYRP